jgi:hypothetical protein
MLRDKAELNVKKKKEKISIDQLKTWAGSQPFFIILFVILVTVSSLVTITEGVGKINSYYLSSFWKTQAGYKKVARLNVNTQIDNYEEILGKPFLINKRASHKEYLFIDELFYVQAVANEADQVVMYSITTRSPKFRPKIRTPFSDNKEKDIVVELGRTPLSVINYRPSDINGFISGNMSSFYYNELYWTGNWGGYLTYGFSYNGAGAGKVSTPYWPLFSGLVTQKTLLNRLQKGDSPQFPRGLREFRSKTAINTYTVISDYEPKLDIDNDDWMTLGPEIQSLRQIKDWKYPA